MGKVGKGLVGCIGGLIQLSVGATFMYFVANSVLDGAVDRWLDRAVNIIADV